MRPAFDNRKAKPGDMTVTETKRLKAPEDENANPRGF